MPGPASHQSNQLPVLLGSAPAVVGRLAKFGARSVVAAFEVGALVAGQLLTGGGMAREGD